ncbi:unnamed protein product [Ectocarpus fasciculatus]
MWVEQGGCRSTRNVGERDWGNVRRRAHREPTDERRGPEEGEARDLGSWRDKRGQSLQWRQEENDRSGGARGGGARAETRRYTPTWGAAGYGTRQGGGGGVMRKAKGLGRLGEQPVQHTRRIPVSPRGLPHPSSSPSGNLDGAEATRHSPHVRTGRAGDARNADATDFPLYKDQAPQPVSSMPWLKQHMLDGPLRGFLEQYYNHDDDEEGHECTRAKVLSDRHLHRGKTALYLFLMYHTNEQIQSEVFYMDEDIMVTYDGFPKGNFHLLVVPRETFLNVTGPSALRKEHLPKLRRLHAMGAALAKALSLQAKVRELSHPSAKVIRCGYHAMPSQEPLHLHVVSMDLDGTGLKRKTHWNSFTTDLFLEATRVEKRLEERGSLGLDMPRFRELEHVKLRCFRCPDGPEFRDLESLKAHNRACTAPVPAGGRHDDPEALDARRGSAA